MKRRCLRVIVVLELIVLIIPALASADRSKMIETALSFLEEGNPFLERYNEMEGTEIEPVCPLGCPYFYGGYNIRHLLKPANPDHASEYYQKDQKYLYGFDCSGFTKYVAEQAGYERHPKISDLLNRTLYTEYEIPYAMTRSGKSLSPVLRRGDLLAIQHMDGGFHIAMFCGTLKDFGYTKETLPEALVPYIFYPLLIHCTASSDYYERYSAYIEEHGLGEVVPPYGGVIISILDVPLSAATSETPQIKDLGRPCFELEGYHLQITDLTAEKRYRWIRWRKQAGE